jgi:hypothetical protein
VLAPAVLPASTPPLKFQHPCLDSLGFLSLIGIGRMEANRLIGQTQSPRIAAEDKAPLATRLMVLVAAWIPINTQGEAQYQPNFPRLAVIFLP